MEFPRLLFKDRAEVTVCSAADYAAKRAEGYTDPSAPAHAVSDDDEPADEPKKGRGRGKH